jgi:hypothetical protein
MLQKSSLHHDASNESYRRNSKRSGHKVPFGLRPLVFGALVALVTLIVVGAALGGGLGSGLATARRHGASPLPASVCPSLTSSLSTTSTTTTSSSSTASLTVYNNYTVPDPSIINTLTLTCQNGSIYQTLQQALSLTLYREQTFQYLCNRGYKGDTAADGRGTLKTLASFVSYTVENCIEACSNMNGWASETVCRAISFATNLAEDYENWGTNCWLFNDTGGWVETETQVSAALE